MLIEKLNTYTHETIENYVQQTQMPLNFVGSTRKNPNSNVRCLVFSPMDPWETQI